MGEESEYAYLATLDALKQANLNEEFLDAHEVGILYGNDSVSQAVVESIDIARERYNIDGIGSDFQINELNGNDEPFYDF